MTFDPSKLTPGPWEVSESCVARHGWDIDDIPDASYRDARFGNYDDAAFICLARHAFEVMMRRKWFPRFIGEINGKQQWVTYSWSSGCSLRDSTAAVMSRQPGEWAFDDPFTCLVEADKWWMECVEKNQ